MRIAAFSAPPDRLWVDKFGWICAPFASLGHDVRRFHHFSELRPADAWADLVIFDHYAAGMPPSNISDAAEDKTAVWVQAWRDLVTTDPSKPVAKQETYFAHGRVMRAMDLVFVKECNRIEEYRAAGVNAAYLDTQACPDQMPSCGYSDQPEFDVLILGNADRAYADRRADAAALVKAGYRVLWAGRSNYAGPSGVQGHRWVHPLKELSALASRCVCALSVELRHEPGYVSDRLWLLAGTGISVVARVPDGVYEAHEAPQGGIASWTYSDETSLQRAVCEAIAEPHERRHRGEAARRRVMERHTYRHRAESIIAQMEAVRWPA